MLKYCSLNFIGYILHVYINKLTHVVWLLSSKYIFKCLILYATSIFLYNILYSTDSTVYHIKKKVKLEYKICETKLLMNVFM